MYIHYTYVGILRVRSSNVNLVRVMHGGAGSGFMIQESAQGMRNKANWFSMFMAKAGTGGVELGNLRPKESLNTNKISVAAWHRERRTCVVVNKLCVTHRTRIEHRFTASSLTRLISRSVGQQLALDILDKC